MSTKAQVLQHLEQNRGKYVSGAEIASALNISRTAVWKSIASLTADGIDVKSRSGSGYMLEKSANTLTAQGICKYLKTKDVDIKILKRTDSTNNVAKKLAGEGAREGAVVFALEQSGGKGRLGRKFYSPPNSGVYMSIILRPSVEKVPYLTVMAGVAVAEGIERAGGKRTSVKWVNDVYADGKKCTGILTEAVADLETGGVEFAVVGIGINVLTPEGGFAPEIRDVATSVCDGVDDARNRVSAEVIDAFFEYYNNFDREKVATEYKNRSFLIGRRITVVGSDGERVAVAKDIDGECRLVVEYEDGSTQTLSAGEVTLRV